MMDWVLESMDKAPSFQHYRGHIDNIIRFVGCVNRKVHARVTVFYYAKMF